MDSHSDGVSALAAGSASPMNEYSFPTAAEQFEVPMPSRFVSTSEAEQAVALMAQLNLSLFYPKGLDRSHFHGVRLGVSSPPHSLRVSELYPRFIQMLRAADYNLRYLGRTPEEDDSASSTASGGFVDLGNSDPPAENALHPMDLLLSVYWCADDLMRPYMCSRLSACQLALPLLVRNPHSAKLEMPLWPLRAVRKSVPGTAASGAEMHKEWSVCELDCPMVCFTRFGENSYSKSRLLNTILSGGRHDIFFHRDCRNSVETRVLVDGLAEIFWYIPSGRDEDLFHLPIAFVNLRGDAAVHSQQAAFLHEIATINVVLCAATNRCRLDEDFMQSLRKKPLIWISPDISSTKRGTEKVIHVRNGKENMVAEKVSGYIKRFLVSPPPSLTLNECADIAERHNGIHLDNGGEDCVHGMKHADEVMKYVEEMDFVTAKEKLLPLSGKWWQQWCEKDSMTTKLEERPGRSVEQHLSDLEGEMKEIRSRQAHEAAKNEFMRTFVLKLVTLPLMVRVFFLKWLGIRFDELSSHTLAELEADRANSESHLKEAVAAGDEAAAKTFKAKIVSLSTQIEACTFGLEHCLREVAQTFEAMQSQDSPDCSKLASAVAELMSSGHPVELMDGDACYVPQYWVKAVLSALNGMIGAKKVFVLSVLGVQSSGKSTFLNTMFGLSFSVSAGRCTRGAFMQLLAIADELKGELGFDYVLVVDTEGLKSSELADGESLQRDNKLAALAIGLASMTLVNVFGESLSDMRDVLQIAVHTFLRMHEVRLSSSCLFVHQNASDPTAAVKNTEARRKFEATLDDMTSLAARQEGCTASRFSEIIRLHKKNYYFSSLWFGSPPMAPVNPRYGADADAVRRAILQDAASVGANGILSLPSFMTRVVDLWTALRHENFVFSFKNTMELCAYDRLEKKRSELEGRLRRGFEDLLQKLRCRIEKGEQNSVSVGCVTGECGMSELLASVQEECERFFKNDDQSDILVQWSERTRIHLSTRFDFHVDETVCQAKFLIGVKESLSEEKQRQKEHEEEIIKKARQLAREHKGEHDTVRQRTIFDDMFKAWLEEIRRSAPLKHPVDVRSDARAILCERFERVSKVRPTVSRWDMSSAFEVKLSRHSKGCKRFSKLAWNLIVGDCEALKAFIYGAYDDLTAKVMRYLERKEGSGYSQKYLHDIIDMVERTTKSKNNHAKEKKYELTNEFQLDAAMHLFSYAVPMMTKMHAEFELKHDATRVLQERRGYFYNFFTELLGVAVDRGTCARTFAEMIMKDYHTSIRTKTSRDIVDAMTANHPTFKGSKSRMESYVLIDLAEREDFDDLMLYINQPARFYQKFISSRVKEYCASGNPNRLNVAYHSNAEHYYRMILSAINESTEFVKRTDGDVFAWIDAFYERIKDNMSFALKTLRSNLPDIVRDDRNAFHEAMCTAWDEVYKEFRAVHPPDEILTEMTEKCVKELTEMRCGCLETCPFCRAVCTNTLRDHDGDHSVILHRPEAIGGWKYRKINEASLTICSTAVCSNGGFYPFGQDRVLIPHKKYRKAGPPFSNWSITPDSSFQEMWKWIMCRFRTQFAETYGYKFEGEGAIPTAWEHITQEEAINSVRREIRED